MWDKVEEKCGNIEESNLGHWDYSTFNKNVGPLHVWLNVGCR